MKLSVKLCLFLLVLIMCFSLVACAPSDALSKVKSAGKLVMLTEATFPPFEYLGNDNKVVGVDIDIAGEIAKDLGVTLEVVAMDFDGIIPAIIGGKGDIGVAGITVTDERKQSIDFSDNYVDATLVILVKTGNTAIKSAQDLVGKVIGVQLGTTSDLLVSDMDVSEVKRYKSGLEGAVDLVNGKVDAVVVDELPGKQIVDSNKGAIELLAEPLSVEQYAVALKKDSNALVDAVNATLKRLATEGFVEKKITEHMATFAE